MWDDVMRFNLEFGIENIGFLRFYILLFSNVLEVVLVS